MTHPIAGNGYQCQDISDANFCSYVREYVAKFHVEETAPTDHLIDVMLRLSHMPVTNST